MSLLAGSSFGTRLRAEREGRGVTLEQVSASTKIPVARLEALERDDLSQWPKGFYRRTLFRAYVTTLGLPLEPLAGEFGRLFLEEPPPDPVSTAFAVEGPRGHAAIELRALLSAGPARPGALRAIVLALAEVAAVLAAGGLLGWATGMTLLTASGAVALVYYPFVRAGAGRTRLVKQETGPRAESTVNDGLRPTTPRANAGAAAVAGQRAVQRLHAGRAIVRTRLARRYSHATRGWVLLTKRTIETANQGLRRGTRAWRAMRHATVATYRVSSRAVTRASVIPWHAGTVASRACGRAARQTGRICLRGLLWANQVFWRALRIAAAQPRP
jgi:transcriptional regulator with XRE-family HTH domain